uniref:ATP-binding protein n=1 Tax=Mycolicibacterium gadium TaxID=1794 RepID=UPI0038B3E85E
MNLCVCGPSGTGKSHFCEALGQLAIDTGRTVAWFSIDELGATVRRHRADDSITKAMRPHHPRRSDHRRCLLRNHVSLRSHRTIPPDSTN